MKKILFPRDFIWGVATAAYQIEGAVNEDGRGPSIWDTFSYQPGATLDGKNGDVACDHYHHWQRDISLLSELNLQAYRFSIAWPRIFPKGRGPLNAPGLAFYDRLVDALLGAGKTPYVTLYHWDLPEALQLEGGWLRRGIVEDYLAYVETVTRALGDRVKHWTTLNEPWVFSWEGHASGADAPGLKLGAWGALRTTHHALLAHGHAVPLIRAVVPEAKVGIVLDMNSVEAASSTPEDVAAARRFDGCQNRWYLDALFRGSYPEDMVDLYGSQAPEVLPGDMEVIAQKLDFLGVNFYRRSVMASGSDLPPVCIKRVSPLGGRYTAMGWEVSPQGLYDILRYVHDNYDAPPLVVSENGAAFDDRLEGERVRDPERTAYLAAHFAEVARAIEDGVPVKGYFVWSLLDNFEWAEGYSKRFGIVYTDYATQRRIIKDSGYFVSRVAASQGFAESDIERPGALNAP